MKILIVEDELDLANSLKDGLEAAGYIIKLAHDGVDADYLLSIEKFDLVILDLNIPGIGGMEVLRRLRKNDEITNVLILSARDTIEDKIEGYDSGTTDYMTKPFSFLELLAHIKAMLRRNVIIKNKEICKHNLTFDTDLREVQVNGKPLKLTSKEMSILEYFLLNDNKSIKLEELIEHVWDDEIDSFSNAPRVQLSNLRKKLNQACGFDFIINVVKEGYKINDKI